MNIKELTRKEKEEIAKRFNVSVGTIYNWIETKSDLIKIIELGLQKENEIINNLDGFTNLDEAVGKMIPVIRELEEKVKRLEEQKN